MRSHGKNTDIAVLLVLVTIVLLISVTFMFSVKDYPVYEISKTTDNSPVIVIINTEPELNDEEIEISEKDNPAENLEPEADRTFYSEDETKEKEPAYSNEDLYILAHLICGEAQDYPDEEQLYVGSVVLNRVASSHYPNSIDKVVFQKGQYACTWDGNYDRTPTERNWKNAEYLLENGSVLPEGVVYQATFSQGSGTYMKTKYHQYCFY